MKLILLAAAAAIAMPAIAQTSGSTGTSSPTSNGGQGTPTDTRNNSTDTMQTSPSQTPSGDMAGQTGAANGQSMPMSAPTTTTTTTGDPVGGYQPATQAMNGPMQPGAAVTYQQAPSPDQAYPAPAPLAKYPVCKPGQFDKCMQGKGSTHSRQVRRRR